MYLLCTITTRPKKQEKKLLFRKNATLTSLDKIINSKYLWALCIIANEPKHGTRQVLENAPLCNVYIRGFTKFGIKVL